MPSRLMCLLFSDDLTVTDSIPLCSLPTPSPQESEFQETASDRSDYREAEDEGLSGTENNTSFLLVSVSALYIHSSMLKLLGRFKMEKKFWLKLVEKQSLILCGEEHL